MTERINRPYIETTPPKGVEVMSGPQWREGKVPKGVIVVGVHKIARGIITAASAEKLRKLHGLETLEEHRARTVQSD